MGYRLDFLLGDLGLALLDCHGVEFVDVLLLVVGLEALDDLLDDCLFGVGVDSAEDDAGGPPHLQVLHVLGFLLGRHEAAQSQEGQAYPLLHILIEYYLHKTCVSHYTIYHSPTSLLKQAAQPEVVRRRKDPLRLRPLALGQHIQLPLYFLP